MIHLRLCLFWVFSTFILLCSLLLLSLLLLPGLAACDAALVKIPVLLPLFTTSR